MTGLPKRAWRLAPGRRLHWEHMSGDCEVWRRGVRDWIYKQKSTQRLSDHGFDTKEAAMSAATAALGLTAGPPPEQPKTGMTPWERMHYIGACALLGRLARHVKRGEDRVNIQRALQDCVTITGNTLEIIPCHDKSFALEPKKEEVTDEKG